MTFTTTTEYIRSGAVSLQFYLPNTAPTINNTVYISKLGNLKYTFDVPQDSADPTAVGAKPGSMKVELFQKNRTRELVDAFRTLQPTERYLAVLNFTELGYGSPDFVGFNGQTSFYVERSSISYDELKDILTINLNPIPLVAIGQNNDGTYSELSISQYFLGNYNTLLSSDPVFEQIPIPNPPYSVAALRIEQFIGHALELITQRINPNLYVNFSGHDTGTNKDYAWYIISNDYYTFTQMLGVIASLSGSLYGSFFDEWFFVNRTLHYPDSPRVVINWSDTENVKNNLFNYSEYSGVEVRLVTGTTTYVAGDSFINTYGEKKLNVSFQDGGLFKGDYQAGSVSPSVTSWTDLLSIGANGYIKALGADNGFNFSIDILGFNNIRPYHIISFASDAPTEYQNKDFRISEIEYDFIQYKIKLSVYEI